MNHWIPNWVNRLENGKKKSNFGCKNEEPWETKLQIWNKKLWIKCQKTTDFFSVKTREQTGQVQLMLQNHNKIRLTSLRESWGIENSISRRSRVNWPKPKQFSRSLNCRFWRKKAKWEMKGRRCVKCKMSWIWQVRDWEKSMFRKDFSKVANRI